MMSLVSPSRVSTTNIAASAHSLTSMTDDDDIESRSPTGDRRASLERLRAVGQTFADGIAAFRERVTTGPRIEEHPEDKARTAVEVPLGPALDNAVRSDDMFPSAVTSRDGSQRKELGRLNSLLEASEARGDAVQEDAQRLREENASLNASVDRSARLLNNLRVEYDRMRAEAVERAGKGSAAVAETARLRTQAVDIERELQRMTSRADEADKRYVEEKKKSAALERVCLGLRRRVAVAEEKAQDSRKLQDAVLARELAEAQLAETKVEAERWRARSSAADVSRERAEAAERSERIQREKIATLERELESRESLLRQGMHEKKKLQEYMTNYEKELEQKEMKLARLRSWIKARGYEQGRPRRQPRQDENEFERALQSDDETDLGTATSLSIEKDLTEDNDVTLGDWGQDITAETDNSIPGITRRPDESVTFVEASPLLREVEEAHAQLQAAFQEPDTMRPSDAGVDLLERVRRLEASFDALAQNRSLPSE